MALFSIYFLDGVRLPELSESCPQTTGLCGVRPAKSLEVCEQGSSPLPYAIFTALRVPSWRALDAFCTDRASGSKTLANCGSKLAAVSSGPERGPQDVVKKQVA